MAAQPIHQGGMPGRRPATQGRPHRPVHQIRLPRLARGQRQGDRRAETQVHRDQLAVHVRARLPGVQDRLGSNAEPTAGDRREDDLLAGYAVPEQEHARMHLGRHRRLVRVRLRSEQHPPDRTHCHRPGSGPEPRHPGARPQRIPVRGQQMPRGAQRHVALPRRLPPDSNRGQGTAAGCPSADP